MFGFFLDQKIVNAHECARVIYENNKIFNAPRVHHESTTSAPRVHHECTTSAPRVHHERTTSAPRWHHECTTSAPRVHHDGTTSAPRVHHESTTSSYAAPSHGINSEKKKIKNLFFWKKHDVFSKIKSEILVEIWAEIFFKKKLFFLAMFKNEITTFKKKKF